MDLLAALNPQQRIAVTHGEGPALVLAGAGSGKTRVIAHRVAYLIRNGATRPENILAVTFTNKAAEEMRDRVQGLLGPGRSAEPLICTFHSFCVRLLRREIPRLGYRSDFSIYDTDDQRRLMKQILEEPAFRASDLAPKEVLSRISYAKNHGVAPTEYERRFRSDIAEFVAELYERYNERLRQANALDFDDLLLKSVETLRRFPECRQVYSDRYRYILVDEYQDTNRPQYDLLSLLTSRHRNLFVVGDEDQSIYKFRGADIGNILRFEKDFAGAKIIRLEQNYRSTQTVLDVAGAVVKNNTERKGKTLWTENSRGDVAECRSCQTARGEAAWVVANIEQILSEEPDCRIAILYRANFLSRNFEELLLRKGIPYALVGSVSFFGRREVKDMLAYLRVIFNPEDDVSLLRIVNTPARGIGDTTVQLLTSTALEKGIPLFEALRQLTEAPDKAGRAGRSLSRFHDMLQGWRGACDSLEPRHLIERIAADTGYRQMLEKQESAEEAADRMANIEELVRAAAESEDRGETVFEFLDRAALSSELDHLDPNARVSLLTMHSAKGLEFDVVFLAGLEEGLFPHNLSLTSKEDIEEERRLCYVGLTRARKKLYLTWTRYRRTFGPNSGIPAQPSRFLDEMPRELVEFADEDASAVWEEEDEDYGIGERQEIAPIGKIPPKSFRHLPDEEIPTTMAGLRAYLEKQQGAQAGKDAAKGKLLLAGTRVRHKQFGDGIVLRREKHGNDVKITVTFSRAGRKTLIERLANLRPL